MIKCSECGYENLDGLDYCDGCGGQLTAAAGAPPPAPAATAGAAVSPTPPAEAATPAAPSSAEPPAPAAAAPHAPETSPPPAPAAAPDPAAAAPPAAEAPTGELQPASAAPAAASPATASAAAAVPFKAKLTLIRGTVKERIGTEFPLDNGKNLIGRWDPDTGAFPEVDLENDDPDAKISRKHAMIIIEDGKLTVEDIGSLNGTYINRGQRLVPGVDRVQLATGDEIIIGKTFFKLTIEPIS